ncbi:glycoside hydrolase superfamily [Talaromyces proteolyticus]|uniref:Glycoside hydrolase superfamily n=1 Tax=Talaromyces proteolyticus TaxID=1131652 RepID=A0AAD4Q170_9EURO|nr:glycoside hydrolase superfamily [Talaromyces proteolyticus]KAH8705310.1 glycoside hydrolase superfamily [Talaromyces proteolyticus]
MKTLLLPVLFVGGLGAVASATTISVDTNKRLQLIEGFGFSQAFTRAGQFQNASSNLQKQALDFLFSTETGAGFSIIRNWIPSASAYTIEPNAPISSTSPPEYVWDNDDDGQVWFTKEAISYGVRTIYADAWSAPGFMKTSGNESTPGYLCGTPGHDCSTGDWRQAYADYLVQYVKFYEQEGMEITHLGFLNEPNFLPDYSQMQISPNATEAISFIPMLYKAVKDAQLKTRITCCDAVGWDVQSNYTDVLMAAGMDRYLGVITSHMYSSDPTYPLATRLPTWLSEAGFSGRFTTVWYENGSVAEGFTWANKIATGIVHANLSAYLYWEGFEINQTQSGSHLVDVSGNEALPSSILNAFTMWARFIRPGALRLATSESPSEVITAAFENLDHSIVVVVTNGGSSAQTIKIPLSGNRKSTSAWLTDNTNQVASTLAKVHGNMVEITVPSHGVVTLQIR